MSTPRQALLVHSPELDENSYPDACPFSSKRAGMMRRTLVSMNVLHGPNRREIAPAAAPRETLRRVHTDRYLDALQAAVNGHLDVDGLAMGLGTEETPVFHGVYAYSTLACGATVRAAEAVAGGEADIAFNPSGGYHHAGPEHAAGFCYVNDAAIACHWLAEQGCRVLFLDLDAHHGDGVQNAFWTRKDVMTLSLHESGKTLFPFVSGFESEIGEGDGRGYSVNVPLPAGTYDEIYLHAFRQIAAPLAAAFAPDVVVLELGMDCLAGDPLTHLSLTNNVYADVVGSVMELGSPIVAIGGGGYHVENTVRAWALMWCMFCGENGHQDMDLGLGGVMLESTDWLGGLRDRVLPVDEQRRGAVDEAVQATIDTIEAEVFPLHGL